MLAGYLSTIWRRGRGHHWCCSMPWAKAPSIGGGYYPPWHIRIASTRRTCPASAYLDALGVERATLVGNSIGGLAALRLALSEPERVGALGLVASAGLGWEVTYALRLPTLPGYGEAAVAWGKSPLGAFQRAWSQVPLLFGRPERVPTE